PAERDRNTDGRPMGEMELRITDPSTGDERATAEVGEVWCRGPEVFVGYLDATATDAAFAPGGWYRTGDLGFVDGDGWLTITGRIKDIVIRGGENIYPREIEEFLYTHPDILDAQVVGVPDARYGEELCAWVRLRPGAPELTAQALRDYAAGTLASYKIPRYVHVVAEFPMTVTGKVRKVEMRERSVRLLELGELAAVRSS
ncbi:MAG: AMP-binding enzyme, partial [Acidimicrobiales bacterium]